MSSIADDMEPVDRRVYQPGVDGRVRCTSAPPRCLSRRCGRGNGALVVAPTALDAGDAGP